MPRKVTMPYTKVVRAKGRIYRYFATGRLNAKGKQIFIRLPPVDSPQFGNTYASLVAARSRRETIKAVLSVPDLVDLYINSPKFDALSDGSRKLYGIYLRAFASEFPTAPAGEIERQDVLRIVDKRAKTPGAANSLWRSIGALYKWARERGHVENEPTRHITALDTGEHGEWPQALVDAALTCDDSTVRLAVHLLLYTAQRIGDVAAMRWTHVSGDVIRVEQKKTGKKLAVPVHRMLAAELARHPRSLGHIIPGAHGRGLSADRLRVLIQAFANSRNFKVVPHGLRKNAVNALLEAGCSAAETAAISGQTLQMVEHYAKRRSQESLGQSAILKWEERSKHMQTERKTGAE